MPKYLMKFTVSKFDAFVVEAKDEGEATAIGLRVVLERNPDLGVDGWDKPTLDVDATRLATYTCAYCQHQSAKEAWGPGRITCPACGRRAPTAEEHHAMERAAEVARAVAEGRSQVDDGGA